MSAPLLVPLKIALLTHALERHDFAHDRRDVHRTGDGPLFRRRAVATERSRDLVEPVDLGEDLIDVLLEHAVEVHALVVARARRRCWTPSRIGVSGFLISCATCRAISPHASTRCARASSVTSSSVTTAPPRDSRVSVPRSC